MSPLSALGVRLPVLAAPMAGGPTTPALVVAAGRAGAAGFLAAGYQTRETLADQISLVRAADVPFGVNVFAPNPLPVDRAAFRAYVEALRPEADRLGVTLRDEPIEDTDHWSDKIDLLLENPLPMVGFTFGMPTAPVIAALRKAGSLVMQTVTSVAEARQAAEAGVDLLVAQSSAAGGHSGTFTPGRPVEAIPAVALVSRVRQETSLPVIGAGGIGTAEDVAAVIAAGASAVAVGTLLLRTPESGASAVHQAALVRAAASATSGTTVTRAFSGRPARGLRNAFIDRYESAAPLGYPAVHNLTSPLRKAALAAGDAELVNLWAGTGYRHGTDDPAADVLTGLAP